MWKALAVTSANWERSIWTPLMLKDAPSASALEPLTAAKALTNGGVRYSTGDKEMLFNKERNHSPLYMHIYITIQEFGDGKIFLCFCVFMQKHAYSMTSVV